MINIKTQIGIKYSPILNMSMISREIGAPYLEYGEARIENPGQGSERVTLLYKERGFIIRYNWTVLEFAIENGHDDLSDATGPTRDFFELLETIQGLKGFGRIRNIQLTAIYLVSEDEGAPASPEDFAKTYLGDVAPSLSGELSDYALTINTKRSDRERSVAFGPFQGAKDYDRHSLGVFDNPVRKSAFEDFKGCLFRVDIMSQRNEFRFKDFKFLLEESHKIVELCLP